MGSRAPQSKIWTLALQYPHITPTSPHRPAAPPSSGGHSCECSQPRRQHRNPQSCKPRRLPCVLREERRPSVAGRADRRGGNRTHRLSNRPANGDHGSNHCPVEEEKHGATTRMRAGYHDESSHDAWQNGFSMRVYFTMNAPALDYVHFHSGPRHIPFDTSATKCLSSWMR